MHNSMQIVLSYLKVSVLLWSSASCLRLDHTCDDIQYNSNNLERDITFREQWDKVDSKKKIVLFHLFVCLHQHKQFHK